MTNLLIPPPYAHQAVGSEFRRANERVIDHSDAGTGKTRMCIDAFGRAGDGRILVLCPMSLVESAWLDDIHKFAPHISAEIAYAKNREAVIRGTADVVIANHDAAKWLFQNRNLLRGFKELVIDEYTAYKNRTTQRTRGVMDIRHLFEYRTIMSGTPGTQSLDDLWAPTFVCDDGRRLGTNFFKYRAQVMEPKQVGPKAEHVEWVEKPGARELVVSQLADITIRFEKSLLNLPPQTMTTYKTNLPEAIQRKYDLLARDATLLMENGRINAINAGVLANKLLQLCTGAVYDEHGIAHAVHTERYDLIMDLIQERPWASLVAFNWRHEREFLTKLAAQRGISFEVIDGETPPETRAAIVRRYQNGELKVVFAHPQSTSHGLTFTRGRTIIWASPTSSGEYFMQFNARQYRAGQTETTEVIMLAARGTREERAYDRLSGKVERTTDLLRLFTQMQEAT